MCPERQRLLDEYESAVRAFATAVRHLEGKQGADFDRANRALDSLQTETRNARNNLDRHRKEHGCGHKTPDMAA